MAGTHSAIEIRDVGVNYGGRWVVRSFGLRVEPGEKVTLTGPSGSGKSTVLKCVLGLVVPQEGSVSVFDRRVDGHGVWEARRSLAYVAQEPDLGMGSVREAVERPFAYRANSALLENLERLPQLMEQFHLAQTLLDKDVSTLSGGEKQRIALVSAILLSRPIILLDEASSALDRENKQAVASFLQQQSELSVLSIAHDAEWLSFSDRVVNVAEQHDDRRGDA